MLYAGSGDAGGHAFVCDGYDGNGLFHFNWGWSGNGDGYYSLSVLNPYESTREDVGSDYCGFCVNERATIYTDPMMEKQPYPIISDTEFYQSSTCRFLGDSVAFYYYAYEADTVFADHAFGTMSEDG